MPQILLGCGTNWQLCDYAASPVYGRVVMPSTLCYCHGLMRAKVSVSGMWYAVVYTKTLTVDSKVSLGCPHLWQRYNVRYVLCSVASADASAPADTPPTARLCLRGVMGYALHPVQTTHIALAREFSRHDYLMTTCVTVSCDTNPDLRYRLIVTVGMTKAQRDAFAAAHPTWVEECGILGQLYGVSRMYERDLPPVIDIVLTEFSLVINHSNNTLRDCPAYAYMLGVRHTEADVTITNPLMRMVDDLIDIDGRVVMESALGCRA